MTKAKIKVYKENFTPNKMKIEVYRNSKRNTRLYCRDYPSAYKIDNNYYLYSGKILGYSFGLNIIFNN